eukprot:CAMPEP_0202686742 /NCGR_PEP_ID=MMETSP1385-20130828/2509_1 /ASSEMBLY_ACC=CAM_ASM_000861 /TAXON_ID=933848 /ORGANISM="Elphidium margaritaceum" /LENGTH=345 /DNA_ID=CAMNT_0049341389 /DNA_START=33 /DNA_END=1066 /DNA_ORIENTATION=+
MTTTKATNDTESNTTLHSQQLLQQSIACINDGMEMENNDQLESALLVYEQGITLLTQANDIETNRDVLPIISANLSSINQRVQSLRDKLQFNTMVTDLRRMHQQSMDLFMQYNALSDQRKSLASEYEQRVEAESSMMASASNDDDDDDDDDVDTICNEDGSQITDADQLMNALYQQYYGASPVAADADVDDSTAAHATVAAELAPTLETTEYKDTSEPASPLRSRTPNIAHDIDFTVYHELDTLSSTSTTTTASSKKFGDALIAGITNEICAYIFEFISGRQLTRLFSISKYWCYCLLYDAGFSHLWKRVIIGADPLRNSLGHNLSLRWVSTKICGAVIRSHAET